MQIPSNLPPSGHEPIHHNKEGGPLASFLSQIGLVQSVASQCITQPHFFGGELASDTAHLNSLVSGPPPITLSPSQTTLLSTLTSDVNTLLKPSNSGPSQEALRFSLFQNITTTGNELYNSLNT